MPSSLIEPTGMAPGSGDETLSPLRGLRHDDGECVAGLREVLPGLVLVGYDGTPEAVARGLEVVREHDAAAHPAAERVLATGVGLAQAAGAQASGICVALRGERGVAEVLGALAREVGAGGVVVGAHPPRACRRLVDRAGAGPAVARSGCGGAAGASTSGELICVVLVVTSVVCGVGPVFRTRVNIQIQDNVLIVSGERTVEHEQRQEGYLPNGVNPESIQAHFDRGVLEIRIPKPEQTKPRQVQIKLGDRQTIVSAETTDTHADNTNPVPASV